MCWWCTDRSTDPNNTAPVHSVAQCDHSVSEILILDELGDPFANTAVECNFGAGFTAASTDASGRICLSSPVGTVVDVRVPNVHEMAAGDGTTTPSGQHFTLRTSGP